METEVLIAVTEVERRGRYFHKGATYQVGLEGSEAIFRNGFYDPLVLRPHEVAVFISSLETRHAPRHGNPL